MKLTECKIINFPTFEDERGSLSLLDEKSVGQFLPFKVKRSFWIHSLKEKAERGNHAHQSCWEVVIAVSGSFSLTLDDGQEQKTFRLDSPAKGIIIPPMVWCRLWDFEQDSVCLTFASDDYEPEGYINSYEEFKANAGSKNP